MLCSTVLHSIAFWSFFKSTCRWHWLSFLKPETVSCDLISFNVIVGLHFNSGFLKFRGNHCCRNSKVINECHVLSRSEHWPHHFCVALRAKTMLCYIFLIKLSPQIDIKLVLTWKAPLLRNLNILGSVRPFGLLEPSACWAWIRSAVICCCCNNWIVITGIITGWKFQDSDTKGQVSGDSDGKSYCNDVFISYQVRLLFNNPTLHFTPLTR